MTPECEALLTGKASWDDAEQCVRHEAMHYIREASVEIFSAQRQNREKMFAKMPKEISTIARVGVALLDYDVRKSITKRLAPSVKNSTQNVLSGKTQYRKKRGNSRAVR